jgi:hypothetical protein
MDVGTAVWSVGLFVGEEFPVEEEEGDDAGGDVAVGEVGGCFLPVETSFCHSEFFLYFYKKIETRVG